MKSRQAIRALAGVLLCGLGLWLAVPTPYREKTYLADAGGCRMETTVAEKSAEASQGSVVLFHGISANKKIMSYLARGFAEQNLRVYAPDFPGHGRTPGDAAFQGLAAFARSFFGHKRIARTGVDAWEWRGPSCFEPRWQLEIRGGARGDARQRALQRGNGACLSRVVRANPAFNPHHALAIARPSPWRARRLSGPPAHHRPLSTRSSGKKADRGNPCDGRHHHRPTTLLGMGRKLVLDRGNFAIVESSEGDPSVSGRLSRQFSVAVGRGACRRSLELRARELRQLSLPTARGGIRGNGAAPLGH